MMRRNLGTLILAAIAAALISVSVCGAGSWRTANIRGSMFSADRGTVADSVMQLSDATYYPVADTSGAVFYVKAGGTVITVTTRRKWINGDNGDGIRCFPCYLSVADTAGQGVDATWLSSNRNLWYLEADWNCYDCYEIAGGADTLIAELTDIVVMGPTAPDSFVTTSGLEDASITAAKVDSTEIFPVAGLRVADAGVIYADEIRNATTGENLIVPGDVSLGDAINDTVAIAGQLDAHGMRNDYAGSILDVNRYITLAPNLQVLGDTVRFGSGNEMVTLMTNDNPDSESVYIWMPNSGSQGDVLTHRGRSAVYAADSLGWAAIDSNSVAAGALSASDIKGNLASSIYTGVTHIPSSGVCEYRCATYVPGVTSGHHVQGSICNSDWWEYAYEAEGIFFKAVTDSVIVSTGTGTVGTEFDVCWIAIK